MKLCGTFALEIDVNAPVTVRLESVIVFNRILAVALTGHISTE